jgi:hypothetical protein
VRVCQVMVIAGVAAHNVRCLMLMIRQTVVY